MVRFVHGRNGLEQAEKATAIFFGAAVENISETDLLSIFAEVPRVEVPAERLAAGMNVIELLASTPLWKGRNDVRRSVEQKGAYLNNRPVERVDARIDSASLAAPGVLIVRKGKKNYALIRVVA